MNLEVTKLLSREEAAKYLGVAKNTLAVWACNRRYNLKVVKVGRLSKYRLQDLNDFINSSMNNPQTS